jgi:AraC-like DNA-binding protein
VLENIAAKLREDLSLAALAKIAGMNLYYLSRLFKQSTRLSPHRYVLEQRIRRAQQYLGSSDLTIFEARVRTGFADQELLDFLHGLLPDCRGCERIKVVWGNAALALVDRGTRRHKRANGIGKLMGLIDRNQVPAVGDDLDSCATNSGQYLTPMLLQRILPVLVSR